MKIVIVLFWQFCSIACFSQGVGINTNTPQPNAILDLSKSTKGLLIPRLTQSARLAINNPAEGLMVYDTTTNRLYVYQNTAWRYINNNVSWLKSPNSSPFNYVYTFDSVALGSTSALARLYINGDMRGRTSMTTTQDLIATGTLLGDKLTTAGTLLAAGTATVTDNINTEDDLSIDETGPTLQLKVGGVNKAFVQTAGDDLRAGTNSGNTSGKIIIRMNGTDIISIDTSAVFKVLTNAGGNVNYGAKLTRLLAPDQNMTPILTGRVYNNGSQAWLSTDGIITKTGTGTYEVFTYSARVSARATILVNYAGTAAVVASAEFLSGVKFKVELFDPVNNHYVDGDFNFIVTDPLNLFD